MKSLKLLLVPIALLTVSCATVGYHAPMLPEAMARHRVIAVLPFEMVFAGKRPSGLTERDVAEIEEQESLAFQASFYNALLHHSGLGHDRIYIEIQPIRQTNRILSEEGIPIRDTWYMAPDELARILGVDAVVHTRVTTTRHLSDLASAGVEVGSIIVNELTDHKVWWALPWGLSKTYDVHVECSLFDGWDGRLLWKVVDDRATDWRASAGDVIEAVNHHLARHFPYRS
jgi:hypothetical protein